MSGNFSAIIEDLMEAGFTEYEAKVYISLLQEHPASAYSISQNSGVPHSRVYDISRRLIKKGYAISSGTNPESFSPLSPEELVDKINRDSSKLTKSLKSHLDSLSFVSEFDPVWNIQTREESIEKSLEIISEAKHRLYIGFWAEEFEVLGKDLRNASKRGVQVYMLVYGKIDLDFGEYYFHERDHLDDVLEKGRSIDCAVDSEICLSGILGSKTEKTEMVWTRNKGLVYSIEGYIIHDFYLAELYNVFGKDIDNQFGPNLSDLRKKFYKHRFTE